MRNDLYEHRKEILEEISEREENLLKLNKETSLLENKKNQAKMIEEALDAYYEDLQKEHYIDRSQEAEIHRVITSKRNAVDSAISLYNTKRNSAISSYERTINNLEWHKKIDSRLRQNRFEYTSDYNKRIKPIEKEYDKAAKEAEKQRDSTLKAVAKDCTDNLKRLFGELEVDIKRFYKNGISAENMKNLVGIMDDICKKGSKIGTIPQSYLQKVYKWKTEAALAPVDVKSINYNKEMQAKTEIKEKLEKAKKELIQSQELLYTKEKALEQDTKKIAELIAEANEKNEKIEDNISGITSEAEEKKKLIIDKTEKDAVKLTNAYEKKKKAIQKNITEITAAIESLEAEKDSLTQEKQKKESELAKTFLLSFGKKKDLKETIEQLEVSIQTTSSQIQEKQNELELEEKKNIDKELESELKKKKEKLEKEISDIADQTIKRINGLNEEIAKLKENAETLKRATAENQKSIEELEEKIVYQENIKTELEKEVRDFHTNYLIKTFGKQYGVSSMIADKKKLIVAESSAIASLKKELSEVEEEIKVCEEEEKRRKEELQKELAKQAEEKELARKEQEERQLRVKRELESKEKEQEIIKNKNADFNIAGLINELENDSNRYLLSPDANPFEEDNKKTITNSIVRKQFVQKKVTLDCKEYLLFFVDSAGNIISDQRLVKQLPVGEKTTASFELKSGTGFNKNNYYLIVQDFNTGEVISSTRYKINISFSNDFDF